MDPELVHKLLAENNVQLDKKLENIQQFVQQQLAQLAGSLGAARLPGMPLPAASVAQQTPQLGTPGLPAGPDSIAVDAEEVEDTDQHNESYMQWDDVLIDDKHLPQSADGQHLAQLLATPPPLLKLKATQSTIKRFTGVPDTPPPTKMQQDKRQFDAQVKIEAALHLLMRSCEEDDKQHMLQACAWLRSSWEDQLQIRRRAFAGRQSWKLDPRTDDNKPRLVTTEEEKKLRTGKGKGKGKGQQQWQQPRQWQPSLQQKPWRGTFRRPRSTSSPRRTEQK
jgi:hypothetical protein